jgi:ABC-type phosphate transport system substrate-binding protein
MFKNIVKSAMIGVAMLAAGATAANAATYEINIYGASAQYKYWTQSAPKFLSDSIANGGLNCATVYTAGSSSDGIAVCPGNPGISTAGGTVLTGTGSNGDNNNYIIRYSGKNSIEGIRSVQDQNPDNTDGCGNPGDRSMGNPAASTFTLYTGTPATSGVNKACTDVTVGVADVEPATFNQESHGYLNFNSTEYVDKYAQNVTLGSGYTHKTNLVIPFAFIKNTNLTDLDNISRSMAGLIYSTQVAYWEDIFGGTQTRLIDACLRHAGSGTHATLDAAVMRGDYSLQVYGEPDLPHFWFNESSGSVSGAGSGMAGCVSTKPNAIGYADADISLGGSTASLVDYQGVAPTKANVLNGRYDFWSYQHGYYKNTEPTKAVTDKLFTWSSKAANMPAGLATYWAAEEEMRVYKANDFTAPQWK